MVSNNDLTPRVSGYAIEVHRTLGPGRWNPCKKAVFAPP